MGIFLIDYVTDKLVKYLQIVTHVIWVRGQNWVQSFYHIAFVEKIHAVNVWQIST